MLSKLVDVLALQKFLESPHVPEVLKVVTQVPSHMFTCLCTEGL